MINRFEVLRSAKSKCLSVCGLRHEVCGGDKERKRSVKTKRKRSIKTKRQRSVKTIKTAQRKDFKGIHLTKPIFKLRLG